MKSFVSMAVLCAMVSTPVLACERPSAPSSIPDGATASKEDMLAAKKAVVVPALGCERPSAPTSIPDGATASKEDMLAAKKAVDAFKSGMEEYLACEKSSAKKDAAQPNS